MLTSPVFKSSKIMINYYDDYFSIIANDDICMGELILIEHILYGTPNFLIRCLSQDKQLFDTLYPRNCEDAFENKLNLKMLKNFFVFGESYILGDIISKFNHSCLPNCHVDFMYEVNDNRFYGVWACRNIKKGEELTFDYVNSGDIIFHDKMKGYHAFVCQCTDEFILDNEKRSKIRKEMGQEFVKRDSTLIRKLVDMYLENEGKCVKIAQKSLRPGCIIM